MNNEDLIWHTQWEDMPMFFNDNDRELMGSSLPIFIGENDGYDSLLASLVEFDDSSLDGEFGAEDLHSFEEMGFSLKKGFRKLKRGVKKTVKKELKPKKLLKRATGLDKIERGIKIAKNPKKFVKSQLKSKKILKRATGIDLDSRKAKLALAATKLAAKNSASIRRGIKVGGQVGTSKYVRAGAAGVSLAFPPAAPAAGAVLAAGQALKAADGYLGATAKATAAARKAIKNTVKKAAKGDRESKRMVGVLSKVAKARAAQLAKGGTLTKGILVLPGGKIKRGSWRGA